MLCLLMLCAYLVNWICNKKISVFKNKNDGTYLVIKAENMAQRDFSFPSSSLVICIYWSSLTNYSVELRLAITYLSTYLPNYLPTYLIYHSSKASNLFNIFSHLCKIHSSISPWKETVWFRLAFSENRELVH